MEIKFLTSDNATSSAYVPYTEAMDVITTMNCAIDDYNYKFVGQPKRIILNQRAAVAIYVYWRYADYSGQLMPLIEGRNVREITFRGIPLECNHRQRELAVLIGDFTDAMMGLKTLYVQEDDDEKET